MIVVYFVNVVVHAPLTYSMKSPLAIFKFDFFSFDLYYNTSHTYKITQQFAQMLCQTTDDQTNE